ncbi:MAG: hypothetical protein WC789_12460 [Lentisphaeria bacterium]|jgi:hypothetical protein
MLAKLVDRFSPSPQVREEGISAKIEDKNENEDAEDWETVSEKGDFQ